MDLHPFRLSEENSSCWRKEQQFILPQRKMVFLKAKISAGVATWYKVKPHFAMQGIKF